MNKAKIEQCERLCREFLERAKAVKAEIKNEVWYFGCKETSALRRTSMELTRALAELRRPE